MKPKNYLLLAACLFLGYNSVLGQVAKPFTPRLTGNSISVKGDIAIIGNNILSKTVNLPANTNILPIFSPPGDPLGTVTNLPALTAAANQNVNTIYNNNSDNNNGYNQEYINVDPQAGIFNSSRADLNIVLPPNSDGSVNTCKQIVYAGLYWTAIYPYERSTNAGSNTQGTPRFNDWNQMKFKVPGGTYQDIFAQDVIYNDATFTPVPPATRVPNTPYVCYKDVTSIIQGLANANGQYFGANIRAAKGLKNSGCAGGWSLVIIYESPKLPSKYISVFDGYVGVAQNLASVNFNVNGFKTLPVGPNPASPLIVKAKIGVSAIEGEKNLFGDNLEIKANSVATYTKVTNTLNPTDNVFNSTITSLNTPVITRLPASQNTLGFDLDMLDIPNPPGNTVLPNNETGASIRISSTSDTYGVYLTTFAVDIIEPKIELTKVVKDISNVLIPGGSSVVLGQPLEYVIGFQNIGNDNALGFTIRDILPINTIFNIADLALPGALPPGVTFTYNLPTRTLVFTIPNSLVVINGPRYEIKIRVRIVNSCSELSEACSNNIQNQAFATYSGQINQTPITDDPSLSTFTGCDLGAPSTSNVLVGIENCQFTQNVTICGNSTVLTAPGPSGPTGYTQYTWSTTGTGTITPVPNTNSQQVTVNQPGVYSVYCLAVAPCRSITQVITVSPFVGTPPAHPVIDDADEVKVCSIDGTTQVPLIYLCGANDTRFIDSGITSGTILWQTSSCSVQLGLNCPEPEPTCTWNTVFTGPDYTVTTAGIYRLRIIDPTNSCTLDYYFDVFQNVLLPIETHRDIICNTPGNITVTGSTGPLSGYEYSLSPGGPWTNTTGVFSIPSPGIYTVYIRLISAPGQPVGCVFTVPNIQIRQRNFTVTTNVTNPLCNGDKGTIQLTANDVRPQYTFSLFNSPLGTLVQSSLLINPNTFTFQPQNPGNYTYTVTTQDGCSATGTLTITAPPLLTATSAVTKPITCTDGEITAYPVGGSTQPTPVYIYSLNPGFNPFQTNPNFPIATAGTYTIYIADQNSCKTQTSITITNNPPPVFNFTSTNVLCYGDTTGTINFVSTTTPPAAPQANGYTLLYSIDNGVNYYSSPNFLNVQAGTYTLLIKYSLDYPTGNTAVCFTATQTVTITQPATALTASGGVSAVACDTNGGNGEVRITNPQGGTPPYEYNFNNGVGPYGASNIANLPPGTYTICIRDSNLCTFCVPVTIDPIPPAPTISIASTVYNCDGTSNTTVTVNNPSGTNYNYTYNIDVPLVPPHNPTSPIFNNVPCGPRNITVNYELVSVPTYSNLLFEDFGVGINTTSPGIAPAYCWNNQPFPPGQPCGSIVVGYPPANCASTLPYGSTYVLEDNQYVVTSALNPNICAWFDYRDHTTNGVNPNGRFLAVNIGDAAGPFGILYSKQINDILPNQPVTVELYVANLIRAGLNGFAEPDFRIELVDGSNNVVAFQTVGAINNNANAWQFKTISLNPGANTSLTFVIRSGSILYNGNDALIDDIKVFQLPKACISTRAFPIILPCNQAFAAQVTSHSDVTCFGANNATITVAAQNFNVSFQYSINNGTSWITQTTSPVVIPIDLTLTGAQAYPGYVLVRYDSTTPASSPCSVSLPQIITQPAAVVASATFTQPTCLVGGSITGSATGGTPNYQYSIAGTVNITNPINDNVFSGLPVGSYILTVRDQNNCADPIDTAIVLTKPLIPNASIAGSDICYDNVNQATIVVTASSGLPPYQYGLDGVYGNNNTFPNLTPATYIITVRGDNGCVSNAITQIIAPRLTLDVTVTKSLDCSTTPPVAIMTGNVSGGTTPYDYQVNINGAGFNSFFPVTVTVAGAVTTFTYNTQNAGTYVFQILDANTCSVVSQTLTIIPITNPTATINTTPTTCSGFSNGSITVNASGGLPTYTYAITAPAAYATSQSSNIFTGLPAGTYTVVVRDQNSCTYTDVNVVIGGPNPIVFTPVVVSPQCIPPTVGSISIPSSPSAGALTGGTAPYTYTLIDQGTSPVVYPSFTATAAGQGYTFTPVSFGLYTLVVVDANGCRREIPNITVSSPPNDLDINISTPIVNCLTGACITVSVGASVVGNGPYFFAIRLGASIPFPGPPGTYFPEDTPGSRSHEFCGLQAGLNYTFIVYDQGTNCYYEESTVTPVPPLTPITAVPIPNNVTCRGFNDGSVTFTVTGVNAGTTSVTYQIINAVTNANIVGGSGSLVSPYTVTAPSPGTLIPGSYNIILTEVGGPNNGCSTALSAPFQILESAVALTVTAVETKKDNCNLNAGIVTITASGGTPQYTYQLLLSTATAPTAIDPGWVSTNAIATESGSFIAYVKDLYGCIQSFPITVGLDPLPTVTVGAANQCTLPVPANGYTFTAVGAGGIGPNYTYSINGIDYSNTTGVFTVPNPSVPTTYTINVKDQNDCNSLAPATIIIYPSLDGSATFTTQPTCNNADGQITINAIGGSGNYTYTIVPAGPTLSSANVFSNAAAGVNYIITIRDVTTTCTRDVPVTLIAPTGVSFTLTTTPTSCTGASDGSLTVNLASASPGVNGNPVYTYQMILPSVSAIQNSPTFSGLIAGPYTIRVFSGRGCFADRTINVPDATPIAISPAPTVVQFACNAGTNAVNNASIQVTPGSVSGGTGTYIKYEFINGIVVVQVGPSNTLIDSNYLGGSYTINVYDSNGCRGTTSATILPYIKLNSFVVNPTLPITCTNNENVQIVVNTTGGTPTTLNYTVVALSPAGNTYNQNNNTGAFLNMPVGDYNITVFNPATNCSISNIYYVNNPNTFNLDVTNIVNATCFNGTNGSATLTMVDSLPTPTNDTGPFTYSIANSAGFVTSGSSPNAGPFTIPFGFPAGVYTVTATLTNPPTCTVTKVFTISSPTDILFTAVEGANVTCTNDKGAINVSVSGGTPFIAPNPPYAINVVNTSTGNTNYGTQTTGLNAGVYTVTVTDANGCPKVLSVTLALPTPINALVAPGANPLCFNGQTDVTISNITGGQGSNYSYSIKGPTSGTPIPNNGPQAMPPSGTVTVPGLVNGNYEVTISDGWNCSRLYPFTITQPQQMEASLTTLAPPTCNPNTASLQLSVTGGTPPFRFSNSSTGVFTLFIAATFTIINNVPAGNYSYYVQDGNNCISNVSNTVNVPLVPPISLVAPPTVGNIVCGGSNTGSISLVAQNGVGNYTYTLWSGPAGPPVLGAIQTTPGNFTNLLAGNYWVNITSSVDCTFTTQQLTIREPQPFLVTFTPKNVSCRGGDNGGMNLVITGGTGVIAYSIAPLNSSQFFPIPNPYIVTGFNITGLTAGVYDIIVQDEKGCAQRLNFTISEPATSLTASTPTFTNETCFGDNDGTITFASITGGTPPYFATQNYTVTVANGVITDNSVYVPINNLGGGASSHLFANLPGGVTYSVAIKDNNGCISRFNQEIKKGDNIIPNALVTFPCVNNLPAVKIEVQNLANGPGFGFDPSINYIFTLNNITAAPVVVGQQATNIFDSATYPSLLITPGSYTIDVENQFTCLKTSSPFNISATDVDPLTLLIGQGGLNEIVATSTGGSGGNTYTFNGIDNGSDNSYIYNVSADYTVVVTDSSGCTVTKVAPFVFIPIQIPNVFTPNEDGNNDGWAPQNTSNYKNLVVYIYDRYGRKVAELKVGQTWNGKYNDNELPTGDYWYVIKVNENDDREYVGHFTLYR